MLKMLQMSLQNEYTINDKATEGQTHKACEKQREKARRKKDKI